MVRRPGVIPEITRLSSSAGITALGIVATEWPHNPWIIGLIAISGVVATHVVPSVNQKGTIMTNPTGAELMGIARPVETAAQPAIAPVETEVNAVETAITDPTTENTETAVADAVPAVEAVAKVAPGVAQAIRDAAQALHQTADALLEHAKSLV